MLLKIHILFLIMYTAGLDVLCGHTKIICRYIDQEGYDRFEYTDEKLSTRRFHLCVDSISIFIFWGTFE